MLTVWGKNVRTQCICALSVGSHQCCFVLGWRRQEQVSKLFVLGLLKISAHVVVLLFCLWQEVYELKIKAQQMFQSSLALHSLT